MSGPDFESLAQPGIRRLRAYDPGHDIVALRRRFGTEALLELGSNESVYGPAPGVRDALANALGSVYRYPDPLGGDLRRAIAGNLGISAESVLLGNGSHELLMMLAQVFAGPGADVLSSQFGFAVYALAARAAAADHVSATALPATAAMPRGHDLEALASAITCSTRLVYLANPNNPTGTWFPTTALADFLGTVPADVLVVVDEAYLDYVTDPALVSAITLLDRFPNLVVTRTFSKAHGLAGVRLGYACAQPGLLAVIDRVRESFNVNVLALVAGQAALADCAHLRQACARNAVERDWLRGELLQRGVETAPSQTNFLLAEFGDGAIALETSLVARGVVVRPMVGYGLPGCLRITVGLRDDSDRLLRHLDEVLP